jgi:spermidine/putrescine transport system permease protein
MRALIRRYGPGIGVSAIGASALWILGMVVLPDLLMVDYSFRPNLLPDQVGGPADRYTLGNYAALFTSDVHLRIFLKTIWCSGLVTVLCLMACYPIAFHVAKATPRRRAMRLLLLLTIPFWINEILRSFAWFIILAYQGPLNRLLMALGVTAQPIRFLSGDTGVVIGMIYAFILFMVFPIYNAMESLDSDQIDAARDLGAPAWRIHWRVVMPHAKPGIAAGCVMVFMLAASSYAVPSILGSTSSYWFTQAIYQWFFEGENWPQGAAYAFMLLLICLLFIMLVMRLCRVSLAEIAR